MWLMLASKVTPEDSRNSRLTLLTGFGGLLLIVALVGADALSVLRRFRTSDEQIRGDYLSQNHILNDIRSDVYVSGTYVRDYLLEPDPERAESFRASLEDVRRRMESSLPQIRNEADLRAKLTDYWGTLAPIFQWGPAERRRSGYAFLRDEVFPRRQSIFDLAGRIAALNEEQLTAGNNQVVSLLLRFQTRLLATLVVALVLGLGMASFSTLKILRLESQTRLRYDEVSVARGQLKDLSARLVEAQETERRALSRELHDEVGQSLSAVLVDLHNLAAGLAVRSPERLRGDVESIKSVVESTIREVRNMALLLRPSMLDDLGLIPALKWQARESSKRTSMDVSVATELDSDDLPDEYKTCIYRVVQEALHNCERHSHAKAVRIRVQQEPDRLVLKIQDDGRGFEARQTKGLGLLGIQERVAQLGGKVQIHSQPGSGTILAVEWPLGNQSRNFLSHETDPHPAR
jgi:signal transduction histidine kinase